MTTIPGSVRVGGFIAPSDTTDVYPTHEDVYGKGGFRPVADTTARDAIPNERRKEGMWVKVLADGKVYTLSGGIGDEHWVEQTMGGGSIDEDTTYYVDGTTGDDANDGLTWVTAKQTFGFLIAGATDAIPREINAVFTCNYRNDIRARDANGHFLIDRFYGTGRMEFVGALTSQETLTCTTYQNDGAVRYGRISVADGTKAWTPGEWRRHFLKITGDDNYYPIYDNDATTLYFPRMVDLSGTPAATIYSAPELLRELVTDPGVKYTFGVVTSIFFGVYGCVLPIFISNLWVDEIINSYDLPYFDGNNYLNFSNVAHKSLTANTLNNIRFDGCYFNLSNNGYLINMYCYAQFYNCVFDSLDDTGTGINSYNNSYTVLMGVIFNRQLFGLYPWSFSEVSLFSDITMLNCDMGIALTDGMIGLYTLGGGNPELRFDTCTTGISGHGSIVHFENQITKTWGTGTEIKFGDTDTGGFAELNANTLQSRSSIFIIYSNSDYDIIVKDEYDPTTSGLTAVNYQAAIDEIVAAGGGGVNVAMFVETAIDLVDETDFTAVEAVPYVTEGVGYLLEVTPTTATGTLTVVLYQDVARLEPVYTLVTDLSDADTYRSAEPFGFELETTGTLYGTAFVTGVGASETFDISITAGGFQPSAAPAPLPSPYGDGIEDDGLGKPRVALPSDGGLQFATGKLKLKPDLTAAVYPTLSAAGVAIANAVTTTTDEVVAAKKLFDAVGCTPLGATGAPTTGTYAAGHEVLDDQGIKYRCTVAGTPGSWELADSVADAQADYATASLTTGSEEILEILTTGDVGILQLVQVWAVVASTANKSTDFRLRVYRTSEGYGRDVMWQASGVARQSYLGAILPAAQDFAVVNDEDMFDTDEACVVYESDEEEGIRYELCRILARSAGQIDFDEVLVDGSSWAADSLVCSVVEFENVPFRNEDSTPANRGRAFLHVRNNHATNEATFYVRVLPMSLGVLR